MNIFKNVLTGIPLCFLLHFLHAQPLDCQTQKALFKTLRRENTTFIGVQSGAALIGNIPSDLYPSFIAGVTVAGIYFDAGVGICDNRNYLYYMDSANHLRSTFYPYLILNFNFGFGYTLKCFNIGKGIYTISSGLSMATYQVGDINLNKVDPSVTSRGTFVKFIHLEGNYQFELSLRLCRYLWLGNRYLKLALTTWYPVYQHNTTSYIGLDNASYYYKPFKRVAQLSLLYVIHPAVRVNPLKMKNL